MSDFRKSVLTLRSLQAARNNNTEINSFGRRKQINSNPNLITISEGQGCRLMCETSSLRKKEKTEKRLQTTLHAVPSKMKPEKR